MFILKAEKRNKNDNDVIRAKGMIPAVFYGKKTESTPIAISQVDFQKVYKNAGETSVISIEIGSEKVDAFVHDVQYDAIKDLPTHVDFYVFDKDAKVEIAVPLVYIGISPAVKDRGAVLVKVIHELNVEALPHNIPREIKVDISALADLNTSIFVKDLVIPEGVRLLDKLEDVVVSATEAKVVVEEAVTTAPDLSTIEVEKKGKKEEEAPVADAKK